MKNLYQTLGVAENADEAAIKSAYRKLAKELHPDVTRNDRKKTERFKEVNEAYAVLGDAAKRKEYDRMRRSPVGADGMPQGFDYESFARTFGGGPGGRMRTGNVEVGGDFDINDIFASLFGGRGAGGPGDIRGGPWGGGRQRVARGPDHAATIEIPFAEGALGGRRTIRTGSGEAVEVQIPPGVESGGRLRIVGRGGPAPHKKGQPGDLYLDIVVAPHPHLRRQGADVEIDLPVDVAEAALGARIEVPTLEGAVTVTVPAGTSSGGRLRLRGRGARKPDGSRGDQYCRVEIVAPKIDPADAEGRKLATELARRGPSKVRRW